MQIAVVVLMAIEQGFGYLTDHHKDVGDIKDLHQIVVKPRIFGYDNLGLTFLGRSSHDIVKRASGIEPDVKRPEPEVHEQRVVQRSPGSPDDDEDNYRYAEAFGILALGVVVILLLGITMLFIIDFGIDLENTDLENNSSNPWGGSSIQSKKIIKIVILIKKKLPVMLKNRPEEKPITVIV